ncbi:DUF4179 domain-containing protein [Clostridium sp. AL.422]|uniref:DUF4179 domain-containing protein n=1 Tax=Clostridium TaxID=1485 RepID=UPI00293DD596|nr:MULTISPECIES: DUF4179 domain-containing protein [unclassified Clostridium]MDV4149990.1 DUF4179 domain-containing protein [Clostridium sp. AL.422]
MKKISINNLKVSSKLDETINNAINYGYTNIKEDTKSKKNYSKLKKTIIVALLTISTLTIGVIATPTIAANIPVIGDIYKKLGFFSKFEDYTNYIGESKKVDGYKFTIDNIVGTPTDLLVGVKVESPIPFEKNNQQKWVQIDVGFTDFGMEGMSGDVNSYYIDDYTAIVTSHFKNVEGKFKKLGDINIKTSYRDITGENIEPISAEFNISVDFTSSFNKIETIKVDKKVNEILKVKSITSSVIGTDIIFNPNIKGEGIEGFEVWGNGRDIYYLEIDGELHYSNRSSALNDMSMMNFPTVKVDDIKNAKSINIIYITPTIKDEDTIFANVIEKVIENNSTYPKTTVTDIGLKAGFYKVECEGDTLKAHFKSDYNPLLTLTSITLSEIDNDGQVVRMYLPKLYKIEDNEYIIEFNDLDSNNKLEIYSGVIKKSDENYDFKTIKIK